LEKLTVVAVVVTLTAYCRYERPSKKYVPGVFAEVLCRQHCHKACITHSKRQYKCYIFSSEWV